MNSSSGAAAASRDVPKTRRQQKEETRARVLDAARRLFAEQGIAVTPTASIAAAAGISHGALFVHFPTRDDLLNELIDELGRNLAAELKTEIGAEASFRVTLERHLAVLARHEALYVRLVAEGPQLPARARAALSLLQSAVAYEVDRAANRERRTGRLRGGPRHLVFNTWIGLVHHYLLNRDLFAPASSVIAAKGGELTRWFVSLMTVDTPRRPR